MDKLQVRQSTFRVDALIRGEFHILGACFHIPVYSSDPVNSAFFATSYHVVKETISLNSQLFLATDHSTRYRAFCVAYDPSFDIAILASSETPVHENLSCALDTQPGEVVLRGFPSGINTFGSTAYGRLDGSETDDTDGMEVLAIYSEEISNSWAIPSITGDSKTPHDIWRGISGGPVSLVSKVDSSIVSYTIGIIKRLTPRGIGGRIFAVPMHYLADLCAKNDLHLFVESAIPYEPNLSVYILAELLSGLEDPFREQEAWFRVSNLFFSGQPVLSVMRKLIDHGRQFYISEIDSFFIRYMIARIALKKGNKEYGVDEMRKLQQHVSRASHDVKGRISALAEARILGENNPTGSWKDIMGNLFNTRRKLESLRNVPDEYITAEVSSCIGWECQKLFLAADSLPNTSLLDLQKLIHDHKQIMYLDRKTAPKQEVVSTMLHILGMVWTTEPPDQLASDLDKLVNKGAAQAQARRNSIFHIQMLITCVISQYSRTNFMHAYALSLLSGELLHTANLSLKHEGVSQLCIYIARMSQKCYLLIQMPLNTTWNLSLQYKHELVLHTLGDRDITAHVIELYADLLIQYRSDTPTYSVSLPFN